MSKNKKEISRTQYIDLNKTYPEQKKAIEKEVNELYKQGILQEYKDQIGPRYYE